MNEWMNEWMVTVHVCTFAEWQICQLQNSACAQSGFGYMSWAMEALFTIGICRSGWPRAPWKTLPKRERIIRPISTSGRDFEFTATQVCPSRQNSKTMAAAMNTSNRRSNRSIWNGANSVSQRWTEIHTEGFFPLLRKPTAICGDISPDWWKKQTYLDGIRRQG